MLKSVRLKAVLHLPPDAPHDTEQRIFSRAIGYPYAGWLFEGPDRQAAHVVVQPIVLHTPLGKYLLECGFVDSWKLWVVRGELHRLADA